MTHIFKRLPLFTPWILLLVFLQPLFFKIEFQTKLLDKEPLEILMESEEEVLTTDKNWRVRKGIIYRLSSLNLFLDEMKSVEVPQDGFTEITYERIARIVFGQKLIIFALCFLAILSISAFISWVTEAWYRVTLNKILHWIGLISAFLSIGNPLPFVVESKFAIFLTSFYFLLFIYLIISYRSVHSGKKESTRFEVLKHTSELDEEGKKPTQTIEWNPLRIGYHFVIIILVGLLVGNFFYMPLFLLQKNYSYEFGILLIGMIVLLCGFYIRNYTIISKDSNLSQFQNTLASFAYLQYRFIRNLAMGIGATFLVVIFVTVLFSILFYNSDVLKHPDLGIIEKSAEF